MYEIRTVQIGLKQSRLKLVVVALPNMRHCVVFVGFVFLCVLESDEACGEISEKRDSETMVREMM